MKKLVFVIDDDASARNGLARLLRAAGYAVHAFDSANKFLETLDKHASGCVLLDLRMPEMSGEELALELKNRNVNIPIIVVTADDDANTRRIAQEMNAQGFFRKPVDGTALLDAINWILRPGSKGKNHKSAKQDFH
jgi:FixJ family two-component response regulator